MDKETAKTIKVPAEIDVNDKGIVSVWIEIKDNYDSLLRNAVEGKVVDESKSVFGAFACETDTAKSVVVLSGQFKFVDESELINSPEEVSKRAMLALAKRLVEYDDCCNVCARQNKCNAESDSLSDGEWVPPNNSVCAKNVAKYFYNQAKK